jgi:hypothetical protein
LRAGQVARAKFGAGCGERQVDPGKGKPHAPLKRAHLRSVQSRLQRVPVAARRTALIHAASESSSVIVRIVRRGGCFRIFFGGVPPFPCQQLRFALGLLLRLFGFDQRAVFLHDRVDPAFEIRPFLGVERVQLVLAALQGRTCFPPGVKYDGGVACLRNVAVQPCDDLATACSRGEQPRGCRHRGDPGFSALVFGLAESNGLAQQRTDVGKVAL